MNRVLKQKLRKEIKSIAFVDVLDDTSLLESGLLDSIDIVDLIIFIEKETDLKISNSDINENNFDSIDKIVLYLSNR